MRYNSQSAIELHAIFGGVHIDFALNELSFHLDNRQRAGIANFLHQNCSKFRGNINGFNQHLVSRLHGRGIMHQHSGQITITWVKHGYLTPQFFRSSSKLSVIVEHEIYA